MTEALPGGWLSASAISSAVSSGEIIISPFRDGNLNPNSYNYTLGNSVLRLVSEEIDLLIEDEFEEIEIPSNGLLLMPGECYLGHTAEVFGSNKYASLITGRSSVGRKFITNHVTAGLIDIGFFGEITLEITVHRPTRVYSSVPFGQIFWFTAVGLPLKQYDGKYQGQTGPTPSRLSHKERS
jgi:dCTP deaminase